jgi:hypothetical protein
MTAAIHIGPSGARKAMLRALHVQKNKLGLDDDAYRAKLRLHFGRSSAAELSDRELQKAVELFHLKGAAHPHTKKVLALFIALYNLGAVDHGTDAALDAFVQRQTGKPRLAFITPEEARSVTEALKAIGARHGFEPPSDDPGGMEARRALIEAQVRRFADLTGNVQVLNAEQLEHKSSAELDAMAKRFGKVIRAELARTAQ